MLISLKNYWNRDDVKSLLAECIWAGDKRDGDLQAREVLEKYLLDDSLELLGSFVNGELAGLIGILRRSKTDAEIKHFAVQSHLRGKRLGSAMIHEISKTEGFRTLRAETDQDAVGFYRNAGFKITSLGEKYPGVERFECVLFASAPEENRS